MAVLLPFCVISGGPGTGKTRTVTAILALLLEQAGRPLRIGMAAPTGKAAARLVASTAAARQQLSLSDEIAQGLPTEAATLHRLLGFRPGRSRPRHGRDNPLHLDVLVVDEASMVDLPLMSRLLLALRPETRLILLGDKDQLASVEAGMVLGDICGRGRESAYSEPLCQALADLADARLEPILAPPIADHVAVLRESYRFAGRPGIAAAATSVNLGQGDAAVAVLTDPGYPDAQLEPVPAERLRDYLRRWLVPRMRACLEAAEPTKVLEGFNHFRILCAVREGPLGVRAVNHLCESVLEEERVITRIGHDVCAGHPLLVTSNDYQLGLYNGDVGMVLADDTASRRVGVWFDTEEGARRVALPRMPSHETAFAMTVHKSQGSEFDEVILVLPHHDSRAMTRELLYTGITRARHRVEVIGSPESVVSAASSRVNRVSGLYEALWQ
jgi:exodeoxyribonuclease V alpha subunit